MLKYILPLGAILAVAPLLAQTAPAQNTQNSQTRIEASNDISTVLNDTNQARHALVHNEKTQAMTDINAALLALHQAQTAAPHEQFVPLYTETDDYSVMGPILASRSASGNQLNQPGQAEPSGQVSSNQAAAQKGEDLTVQRVYGEFTSVKLDTNLAETHLQAAKQELENGNTIKADEGLKATQDAAIVNSADADLPLLRARENLMLARSAANSGDYPETVVALRAAGRALNNYAKYNGAHADAAKTLAEQISKDDRNTAETTADLTTQINSWWGQTTNWINSGSSNQSTSNISE